MSPVDSQIANGFSPRTGVDAYSSMHEGSQGVAKLLENLAHAAPQSFDIEVTSEDAKYENKLAVVRLGMATSLFSALRAKHAPSASHCLRVALVCAAWCDRLRFPSEDRDRLEASALLHDIGKIGIPDRILRKPGKLTVEEQLTMSLCPQIGIEILQGCCSDPELLKIIKYCTAWYGGRHEQDRVGEELPIESRMLAIADAFDAMTTDHVYRPALPREVAMKQLINNAGTQFDPDLTHDYCLMMQEDPERIHRQVLMRWLQKTNDKRSDTRWSIQSIPMLESMTDVAQNDSLRFHDHLLHHMNDGVIFIDRDGIVRNFNQAAERLCGMIASAVVQTSWSPSLLGLCDDEGPIDDSHCPVRRVLTTNGPITERYSIRRSDDSTIPVRINAVPVRSDRPGMIGVVLIVHDASQQRHLEERVETLHRQANHDPLTKVANRAAFDKRLNELISRRTDVGKTFSLIICDIDHFKRVNDLHGHQAGDEALVTFAQVLTAHSREGDLVGRYGGEEFVLLSPDCDLATATSRAETIRQTIENTLLPSIGNQAVTASFGVTEVQPGDSADSVVARADRGLLQAKDSGRNRVIQLGIGASSLVEPSKRKSGFWSWFERPDNIEATSSELVTPVPASLAINKLRGFIADHKAEIVSVSEGSLHLRVTVRYGTGGRRNADAQIPFNVKLRLTEANEPGNPETRRRPMIVTKVKMELSPVRTRDRRRQEIESCSTQIVLALKSYLMGRLESE